MKNTGDFLKSIKKRKNVKSHKTSKTNKFYKMKRLLFPVFACPFIVFFSCNKNTDSTNTLTGKYRFVKYKGYFTEYGKVYSDSISGNLGYIDLRNDGHAYIAIKNHLNCCKIIFDTTTINYDTINYKISGNVIYVLSVNNVVIDSVIVVNNQFVIKDSTYNPYSTPNVRATWEYYSK